MMKYFHILRVLDVNITIRDSIGQKLELLIIMRNLPYREAGLLMRDFSLQFELVVPEEDR